MNTATFMAYIGGIVRLATGIAGGFLAKKGLATEADIETLAGAIVVVVTAIWSIWSKYKALQTPPQNASGIKPLGSTSLLGLAVLLGLGMATGCVAIRADSTKEGAGVWAFGWGADSSAKLANVAVTGPGKDAQTGVSFDSASGDQQTAAAFQSLVSLGAALAPLIRPGASAVTLADSAPDTGTPSAGESVAPAVEVSATVLEAKKQEAKSTGKPLVVIAGNVGCGYCSALDKLLDADSAFTGRSDIVLYRETSAWASNKAAKWTGGGLFPVVRVTQWNATGKVLCDSKINRPTSVSAIEAALGQCAAPEAVSAVSAALGDDAAK